MTWPATPEKYHLVIFIDNQCSYCTDVVKRVQQYTDAGLTMSFLTVAPPAIKQQVIGDMARVWCSVSPRESLRKAMTGFLPDNDATPECVRRVMAQSALAERVGIQVSPVMVVVQDKPVVFLGNASPSEILKALEQ
ncbi:thioredoxin fold domain-containing protein [Rahnella aceris]